MRLVARGLDFGNQLRTIVERCIKLAKNSVQQQRARWLSGPELGLEEWWSWISYPAQPMNFFSHSQIFKFFGGLVTGTPSAKFPVLVHTCTTDSAKLQTILAHAVCDAKEYQILQGSYE